jgi:hypothetical protein
MRRQLETAAIPALRWTVGVVVLLESCRFAFSTAAVHAFANSGLPLWIRPVLGGTEALAALLFLVPPARAIGGVALLVIFGVAVLIHLLHGWYDVGALVVYAMAVLACLPRAARDIGSKPAVKEPERGSATTF